MSFGLDRNTIQKFYSVFAKYPEVEEVLIYGSRAKGNFREGSDIDLTLVGDYITEQIFSKIRMDLDDLNTPYIVDLSVFHLLKSESLLNHIKRIGKLFYEKAKEGVAV